MRLIAKENLTAFTRLGAEDMEAVVPGLLVGAAQSASSSLIA